MNHGRYEVEKIGDHEGPQKTTSVVENMKGWYEQSGRSAGQEGRL